MQCISVSYSQSQSSLNLTVPSPNCHKLLSYFRANVSHFSSFSFPVRIVHLCRRRSDGALVILKEIPVEQMSRDERLAAQNECQVLKLLNHPNIIEYYENFLEDKALMIAMEYAPGKLAVVSHYNSLFCSLYSGLLFPSLCAEGLYTFSLSHTRAGKTTWENLDILMQMVFWRTM